MVKTTDVVSDGDTRTRLITENISISIVTDHFSGPDRAIGPVMCLSESADKDF